MKKAKKYITSGIVAIALTVGSLVVSAPAANAYQYTQTKTTYSGCTATVWWWRDYSFWEEVVGYRDTWVKQYSRFASELYYCT